MPQYEAALSSAALQRIYAQLAQMRASGRHVTPEMIRAAYSGALDAEAQNSLQNRQIAINREQNEKRLAMEQERIDLMQKQYKDQMASQKMAGLATMLGVGAQALPAITSLFSKGGAPAGPQSAYAASLKSASSPPIRYTPGGGADQAIGGAGFSPVEAGFGDSSISGGLPVEQSIPGMDWGGLSGDQYGGYFGGEFGGAGGGSWWDSPGLDFGGGFDDFSGTTYGGGLGDASYWFPENSTWQNDIPGFDMLGGF